ncbi:hypothetical protein A2422_02255 [Candidatus Woesebacteria bacterium RIFOXYC1_FULL_31_51]|uniref:Uncharacterized protein n=1 Tax=Candidatus Woesebacteria bacterium GW2011_GWC2_31_9 TaxID=1618586 RepID=A0A0F9YIJ2_9BACT|nr:MAG: hypothetical protein UR17_C0001G0910 [Candidatus Woesebacteria bacterium GW2011_GWF1_31_35]KKP23547.1 MAG: hypothetical protein UR11_C0001G0521 [Candidatus Woesebacteria bacterium GW2011_GWC1_30_29]KKP25725.1 MAG: hypothetical protein UR13_C0007G0046 [Candidatus Woesebacteria bacterium GW2011_GWD1_31_12]KKP27823.1 MAG: hypothetical protein UR16_C0002G0153 [Candidatus Woesebacteria bacterium GW2011_GWB1_31_29]KKP31349.1 MAG: hypothetical protein UR21_C0011G0030 [Candidatus Woesebacteria 
MTKKDKNEVVELFNQGMSEIILPVLDEMNKKMATKEDIKSIRSEMATKEDIKDVGAQLDSIERKVEAQQLRSDRHGKDIETLKKACAFA